MKPRLRLLILLWIMLSTTTFAKRSGSTGGGDNKAMRGGNAWFLGTRTIRYCLVEDNIGLSHSQLVSQIEKAFSTWDLYIQNKNIFNNVEPALHIANNRERIDCDGSEDLKFYFGVIDKQIEKIIKLYENPTAFAQLLEYDIKTGWGKGIVWVAPPASVFPKEDYPNWTAPHLLLGILLHELGHVYGCDHVKDTIMTESIGYRLRQLQKAALVDPAVAAPYLTQIDWARELVPCLETDTFRKGDCQVEFDGTPSGYDWEDQSVFKRFTGKTAEGGVAAKLSLAQKPTLTLLDSIYSQSFHLNFEPFNFQYMRDRITFNPIKNLFYVTRVLKLNPNPLPIEKPVLASYKTGSYGTVRFGTMTAKDGVNYPIVLERNTDAGKVQLNYFYQGKTHRLFRPHVNSK